MTTLISSVNPIVAIDSLSVLIRLLSPFAPHITEELWELLGQPYSIHKQPWPDYDPQIAAEEILQIVMRLAQPT